VVWREYFAALNRLGVTHESEDGRTDRRTDRLTRSKCRA